MSNKFKTKSGEYVKEYTRPGVCEKCGHAAVQPDGHYYEDVKVGDTTKRILVNVWCFECIPDRLREILYVCPKCGTYPCPCGWSFLGIKMIRVGARIFLNEEQYKECILREREESQKLYEERLSAIPKFFIILWYKFDVWYTGYR
jgi:hypothetical protein